MGCLYEHIHCSRKSILSVVARRGKSRKPMDLSCASTYVEWIRGSAWRLHAVPTVVPPAPPSRSGPTSRYCKATSSNAPPPSIAARRAPHVHIRFAGHHRHNSSTAANCNTQCSQLTPHAPRVRPPSCRPSPPVPSPPPLSPTTPSPAQPPATSRRLLDRRPQQHVVDRDEPACARPPARVNP